MKKTIFTAAILAAFTFTACSSEEGAETAEATTEMHEGMHGEAAEAVTSVVVETPDFSSVAEPVEVQIEQLLTQYFDVKNALVASDPAAAQAAAREVLTLAQGMPVATLTGDAKAYAEEKTSEVISSAEDIAAASEVDAQRQQLELLSEAVFSLAKAFGAADQTLYYQHCPMALNDKGAYWLSSSEDIENPYFGEKMLHCGSTEEVYKM